MKSKSAILLFLASLMAISNALCHLPFETTTVARLQHARLEVVVTVANNVAAGLISQQELAMIDPASFEKLRPRLLDTASGLYEVTADGVRLSAQRAAVKMMPGGDIQFIVIYPDPSKGSLRFDALYLRQLGYRFTGSFALFDAAETQLGSKILTERASSLEVSLAAPDSQPTASATPFAPPQKPPKPAFVEFLKLGVDHILTGYDHLLFLCGLLVACRRVSSMLAVVTCFTLAHSMTLALAALDIMSIPSAIVEPLIAASIVFVGVENLVWGETPKGRGSVAFGFGLIHGFGFASVLRATGLGSSGASLAVPLFSFNLGVELGQLAVAAVFVPIVWQLRRVPLFASQGTRLISLAVIILGGYWLLQRTVLH